MKRKREVSWSLWSCGAQWYWIVATTAYAPRNPRVLASGRAQSFEWARRTMLRHFKRLA